MARSEKCGLDENPKTKNICLTFSPSRFRLAGVNSLSISGRGTTREKQFKLIAFGLMLIDQVKGPVWIPTDIYQVRSIGAFKILRLQANTDYSKYTFLIHVTVALDQRKQKYTEFLEFRF